MKGATSSVQDAGRYIVMSVHAGKHLKNIKMQRCLCTSLAAGKKCFAAYSGCLTYKNINERGRKQ